MTRALALLDKPSPASFGMTPVVVEDRGQVRVLGLAPPSVQRGRGLAQAEVQELIRGGHALATENIALPDGLAPDTVALWLGDAFDESARALKLPPAPLPASSSSAAGGKFFLGAAESMYPYLERWTVGAFRRFREEREPSVRRAIAGLMRWVLPNRPESLTAAWSSSQHQDRELDLQLRTFARDRTAESLRAEHERRLDTPSDDLLADLRLVVFTGGTETGRDELAERFAKQFELDLATFRRPIDARVLADGVKSGPNELKWLLMDRGQAAVETSPLGLALAALRLARSRHNILVVDGMRHDAIRETLRWLQPRQLYIVGVTADVDVQRSLVKRRGLDPDRLFQHGTEREIPKLTREADRRIRRAAPDSELREIFESIQT